MVPSFPFFFSTFQPAPTILPLLFSLISLCQFIPYILLSIPLCIRSLLLHQPWALSRTSSIPYTTRQIETPSYSSSLSLSLPPPLQHPFTAPINHDVIENEDPLTLNGLAWIELLKFLTASSYTLNPFTVKAFIPLFPFAHLPKFPLGSSVHIDMKTRTDSFHFIRSFTFKAGRLFC